MDRDESDEDLDIDSKKERTKSLSSAEKLNLKANSTDTNNMKALIMSELTAILTNETVTSHWMSMFNAAFGAKMTDLEKRMDKIETIDSERSKTEERREKKDVERDVQLNILETKLDDIEQERRQANLIISGIGNTDDPKKTVTAFIKDRLNIHVTDTEIKFVTFAGKSKEGQTASEAKMRPIRIAFHSIAQRNKVFRSRTKLKGEPYWIRDDLTPMKARLFYKVRESCKHLPGALSWSIDGKIFLKWRQNDRPTRIRTDDDLTKSCLTIDNTISQSA